MKVFQFNQLDILMLKLKKENSDSNIYGLALAYSQNNNLNESEKLLIFFKKISKKFIFKYI